MAQPYLNGSFWWLRKKVPDDLRPIIGKREEKFSLKTRDPAEARILFAKAAAEIEERWGRLRQGVRTLSHKECVAMAGEIYRRMVAEQEQNPSDRIFDLLLDQHAHGMAKVVNLGSNKEATAKMFERIVERRKVQISERIDRFLIDEGHRIDVPSRAALQKHAEQAILKARAKTFRMSQGDYSPDPAAESFPAYVPPRKASASSAASKEPTLTTAIAGWVKEKTRKDGDWAESSAKSNELWATRFKELVGDKPLKECVKADARAFKEAIMSLPPRYTSAEGFEGLSFTKAVEKAKTATVDRMSDRNVNKILGFVRAFWNWAAGQYDDIPSNPFDRMNLRVKSKARDERLPFSAKQLQAIFDAPLFTGCQSPKSWLKAGGHIPADQGIYWVPLIALFTGARAGEIIQLLVDDIQKEGGVLHFNITDDGEEQNVKTDTSIRTIPVHPMLKKLGFKSSLPRSRRKARVCSRTSRRQRMDTIRQPIRRASTAS